MNKKPAVLLIVFCVVSVPAVSGFSAEAPRENLLWDGFVLTGVEGKLSHVVTQGGSKWLFEFGTDVNDLRAEAPAGTKLMLLPSLILERLIADIDGRSENIYRISGWVTRYKGTNFIFPSYFLPVSTKVERQPSTGKESEKETERPEAVEPNDLLAMPEEIRERLSDRRIVRPRAPGQTPKTETIKMERDTILVNRSALLVKQNNGQLVFVLNALGRDVRPVSLRLLPCEALELAEFAQSAIPEPVRFKISGIVTKYKGEKYLLLQKATHIYSHGNFAR